MISLWRLARSPRPPIDLRAAATVAARGRRGCSRPLAAPSAQSGSGRRRARRGAWHAASTLEQGRARNDVLADALRLARAASWAFVEYLGRLARSPHPVQESLRKVLNDLIEGYHALAAELPEPDEQLRSVVKAGRGVLDRLPAGVDGGPLARARRCRVRSARPS